MISCLIRVTDKYVNSATVSIQQAHIDLFVRNQLRSIVIADQAGNFLSEHKDHDLAKLIGSAISNGRRTAPNGDIYYLGNR